MTSSVEPGAAERQLAADGDLAAVDHGRRRRAARRDRWRTARRRRARRRRRAPARRGRGRRAAPTTASSVAGSTASSVAWTLDSSADAVAVDRLVARQLADPLGGRAQLAGEVALDRRLERAEPVEAELGGQPHDGGRAGPGCLGEVGDGAEPDELRAFEHDLGDAPLGRRELRARQHATRSSTSISAHGAADEYAARAPQTAGPSILWPRGSCQLPASPDSFASDNAAGAHPAVLDAIARANDGHALAYGDDPWTARVRRRVPRAVRRTSRRCSRSTAPAPTCWRWRRCSARPTPSCARDWVAHRGRRDRRARAHPRRQADRPADAPTASCMPEQLDDAGPPASATRTTPSPAWCRSPRAPSSARCTPPDEVAAICDRAHRLGMTVHMDGAAHRQRHRRARRRRRQRCGRSRSTPASTCSRSAARRTACSAARPSSSCAPSWPVGPLYLRKQVTQLPSKMRFVAAQFLALLDDDLLARLAGHANAMAQRAARGDWRSCRPSTPRSAPQVNSLFPVLRARS